MATEYGFGRTVTNGLVLSFDGADRNSFIGSGTTFRDLSGNGNNATVGYLSFNNNNGGRFLFNGNQDGFNFLASSLTTTATFDFWCQLNHSYTGNMLCGWSTYDIFCANGAMGFNTFNGDVYGITSASVNTLGLVNNWKHYVIEWRSDVSYTNNKIYINGVQQTLTQVASSENAGNRSFNSGNGRFPGSQQGYVMALTGSNFKVYNRSLTQDEITQNFNATKTRFGL